MSLKRIVLNFSYRTKIVSWRRQETFVFPKQHYLFIVVMWHLKCWIFTEWRLRQIKHADMMSLVAQFATDFQLDVVWSTVDLKTIFRCKATEKISPNLASIRRKYYATQIKCFIYSFKIQQQTYFYILTISTLRMLHLTRTTVDSTMDNV